HSRATWRSLSELISKVSQRAFKASVKPMRGSRRAMARARGPAGRIFTASALGDSIPRVHGRTAKILALRYSAVNPNIGRVLTFGQVVTSEVSAADQAFISSEIFGRAGRRGFSELSSERRRCTICG